MKKVTGAEAPVTNSKPIDIGQTVVCKSDSIVMQSRIQDKSFRIE